MSGQRTIVHHSWNEAYRAGPAEPRGELPTSKVLLVGEDNPQSSKPHHALWPVPAKGRPTCAGRNLQARILRIDHLSYYGLWRTNLCLDGGWVVEVARRRAAGLLAARVPWRTIVMLGRKVAGSFEHATNVAVAPFGYEVLWNEAEDAWITLAALPHPSGRSRAWNDVASYGRALDLLRRVAPEVAWGSLGTIPVDGQVGG